MYKTQSTGISIGQITGTCTGRIPMGCDIHAYLEVVSSLREGQDQPYVDGFAKVRLDRNYGLFTAMAGVRGSDDHAVVQPRGVPKNLSYMALQEYTLQVSHDDPEGCTPEQVERWGTGYWDENKRLAIGPDWHSASWLGTKELKEVLKKTQSHQIEALVAAMEVLDKTQGQSRLVFWFDN